MNSELLKFLDLFYAALSKPNGIYVRTTDLSYLRNTLYKARAESKDPSIAHIILKLSPRDPEGEVWMLNVPPGGVE